VPVAALLAALPWLPTLRLTGRTGAFAELLAAPSDPHLVGWAPVIAMIVADELLFRGWLTRTAGPLRAGLVWCVVRTPFDPAGAIAGLALGGLAARAGPLPGLVARLLALFALV